MAFQPRPRLEDSCYVGRKTCFLTFCTSGRRPLFQSADVISPLLSQILQIGIARHVKQIAYVVMPDHVHLLVRGERDESDLLAYAHRVKQKSGFEYRRQHGSHLWQPSFYDHVLRADEEEVTVLRYMVLNPVKARLVEDPADYPYWSVADWPREDVLADVRDHLSDVWTPPTQERSRRQD